MVSYSDLLHDKRWKQIRKSIIDRDKFKCQRCFNVKLFNIDENIIGKGFKADDGHIYLDNGNHFYKLKNIHEDIFNLIPSNQFLIQYIYRKLEINKKGGDDFTDIEMVGIKQLNLFEFELSHVIDTLNKLQNRGTNILKDEFLKFYSLVLEKYGQMKFRTLLNQSTPIIKSTYINFNDSNWYYLYHLNVHHTYYQQEMLPWEYEPDSLITYCRYCHLEVHKEESIPFLNKAGIKLNDLIPCVVCSGTGYRHEFVYYEHGICFPCNGSGFNAMKYSDSAHNAQKNADYI